LALNLQSLDVQTFPPIFVKEAFELVTQTEQSVSQMRNEAEGDASSIMRRSEGEAQAIISEGLTEVTLSQAGSLRMQMCSNNSCSL
jgi:regulator of protease activity HflC (stomatin/prohibitin superfamily)